MSLHFRMKGRLVFGGEADATRLFATLSADPFLREALTLRGAAIVAAFDDFVSYAGPDLQTSTARLAEAAKQARSGRVLFRYEGETADWCIEAPPRVFGPKPKKNEHSERFGVVGELGFAEALEARAARSSPSSATAPRSPSTGLRSARTSAARPRSGRSRRRGSRCSTPCDRRRPGR